MKLVKHPSIYSIYSSRLDNAASINDKLLTGFMRHQDLESTIISRVVTKTFISRIAK